MSVKEVEEARRNGRLPDLDNGETRDAFVLKRSGERWPLADGGTLEVSTQSTTSGRSSTYSYRFPGSKSGYPVDVSTLTGKIIVDGGLTQYVVSAGRLVGYCDLCHELTRAADALESWYARALGAITPEASMDGSAAAGFLEETLGVPVRGVISQGDVHGHEILPIAKSTAASVVNRIREVASMTSATVSRVSKALDFLSKWAPGLNAQALLSNKDMLVKAILGRKIPEPPSAGVPGVSANRRALQPGASDTVAVAEDMIDPAQWKSSVHWATNHKEHPLVLEMASLLHGDHRVVDLLEAVGARYALTDKSGGHLLMHLGDTDAAQWVSDNLREVQSNISGIARLTLSALKAVLAKQPTLTTLLVKAAGTDATRGVGSPLRYAVQHLWDDGWLEMKQEGLAEVLNPRGKAV